MIFDRLVRFLLPRQDHFFTPLEAIAGRMTAAATIFAEPMRQLVQITVKAVGELAAAVGNLRQFRDPESIRGQTVAVHTLENEADAVYRRAVETLFSDGFDPRELVRQKDMLFSLEAGV